jgi:hypothetical protein
LNDGVSVRWAYPISMLKGKHLRKTALKRAKKKAARRKPPADMDLQIRDVWVAIVALRDRFRISEAGMDRIEETLGHAQERIRRLEGGEKPEALTLETLQRSLKGLQGLFDHAAERLVEMHAQIRALGVDQALGDVPPGNICKGVTMAVTEAVYRESGPRRAEEEEGDG